MGVFAESLHRPHVIERIDVVLRRSLTLFG